MTSREMKNKCGCEKRGERQFLCEYHSGFEAGAESVRKALGVQPAGDGYVFLRGFWDADDDSVMLSRECSAPHAWAILTGEDAT